MRKLLAFFRCFLLAFLALGLHADQEPDPSNPSSRPNSSQGLIPVKNGRVDAVHGSLFLSFPLGPHLPGRLPGRFAWELNGWRGGANGGTWYETANFRPVTWPQIHGAPNPNAVQAVDLAPVTVRLFGRSKTFGILSAPYGPDIYSLSTIRAWLTKRGVVFPSSAYYFLVYASTDGTSFYVEGLKQQAAPYYNPCRSEATIVMRAMMDGELAAWWTRDDPGATFVGNIWNDRVVIRETVSDSSPFYTVRITDQGNPSTDWVQLQVNGMGTPEVSRISDGFRTVAPYVDPKLVPFVSLRSQATINVTNGLGIAAVTMSGFYYGLADGYLESISDPAAGQPDLCVATGIIDHRFFPSSLDSGGAVTTFTTDTDVTAALYQIGTKLTISYPSGLIETFESAYGIRLPLWNADPYLGYVQTPDPGGKQIGSFTWQECEFGSIPNSQSSNTLGGIVRIVSQEAPGLGTTTIITQVVPQLASSGNSFIQPRHVTNILTYPSLFVDSSSPFRGTRLVHPSPNSNWNQADRPETYLFFSSVILQEQKIHGYGAPYSSSGPDLPSKSTMLSALNWEPSGYIVDSYTTNRGWQLTSLVG